ncbi:hypothetical protein [Renibacterium salmoninarum]|nr:hypothetical protein [Renibacterium salmoninarum]
MFHGAAHERAFVGDVVADLEADALGKEPHYRLEVHGADHCVAELARLDFGIAHNPGGPAPALDSAGAVAGSRWGLLLRDPGCDVDVGGEPGDGLGGEQLGTIVVDRHA